MATCFKFLSHLLCPLSIAALFCSRSSLPRTCSSCIISLLEQAEIGLLWQIIYIQLPITSVSTPLHFIIFWKAHSCEDALWGCPEDWCQFNFKGLWRIGGIIEHLWVHVWRFCNQRILFIFSCLWLFRCGSCWHYCVSLSEALGLRDSLRYALSSAINKPPSLQAPLPPAIRIHQKPCEIEMHAMCIIDRMIRRNTNSRNSHSLQLVHTSLHACMDTPYLKEPQVQSSAMPRNNQSSRVATDDFFCNGTGMTNKCDYSPLQSYLVLPGLTMTIPKCKHWTECAITKESTEARC